MHTTTCIAVYSDDALYFRNVLEGSNSFSILLQVVMHASETSLAAWYLHSLRAP